MLRVRLAHCNVLVCYISFRSHLKLCPSQVSSLISSDRSLQLPGFVSNSLTDFCCWHLNDVTQIEEDTKSIIAEIEIVFCWWHWRYCWWLCLSGGWVGGPSWNLCNRHNCIVLHVMKVTPRDDFILAVDFAKTLIFYVRCALGNVLYRRPHWYLVIYLRIQPKQKIQYISKKLYMQNLSKIICKIVC